MTKTLLLSVLLLLPSTALAAPLTWTFAGEVTSASAFRNDFTNGAFPTGAAVSYALTFDPDWSGWTDWSCSDGGLHCDLRDNERGARLNFTASIAGHGASYSLNPLHGGWDAATRHFFLETTLSSAAVVGDPVQGATLTWYPMALNVDLHLPLTGGPAAPTDAFTYYLDFTPTMGSQAATAVVQGRFLSVADPVSPAAVPEPSAIGLLALGLAAFLRRTRP